MKYFISLFFIFITTQTFAEEYINEEDWVLNKFSLYIENDLFSGTDDGYSAGESISLLYYIPNDSYRFFTLLGNNNINTDLYISFSFDNQIFTPTDILNYNLIPNDRPYASWTYFQYTLHKASEDQLRSLSLKLGLIGPSSGGDFFQKNYHRLMGFNEVNGWNNQLKDEVGLNLKYVQKWRFELKNSKNVESTIIPFTSAEFGNIAINAKAGITSRFGWNTSKDFGISSIDLGADPSILAYSQKRSSKSWGFSFNFTLATSAIIRDIFLDGNSYQNSHSVEKEFLVGHLGYGFTLRYKDFTLDFMETASSKQFGLEKHSHRVGSLVLSYIF